MVVGGAKGITAEVCVDLANRFGCNLALVGRSALEHDDPLSVDMDAAKARAKERIEESGERVTPVAVQDELWPLESQRKIAENIRRMREAGSDVEYFSCDVADQANVDALFDRVRERFGEVDGIIHAAGVEESKMLDDKTPESFDKVFCGKAFGGLNLWRAAQSDEPSFFLAFSSVAGRFGNEGQVDYSAANEVLGKLVAKINATSNTRGLIIDWTAWDEVGMATAGSMRSILEHRGVEFLPPAIGAPLVGDAMERGLVGEVLVAGKLGQMAGGDDVLERSAMKEQTDTFEQEYVFVDRVTERDADSKLVVERVFDPERDYFLDDHVYQGVPVLPGVMGYEFMVETATELIGQEVAEVSDVSFERAVKFHHGEPLRIIATAEVVESNGSSPTVAVKLETEREAKTGRTLRHEHFTATVTFGPKPEQPDTPLQLDPTTTYLRGPNKLEIYKRFFHTGRFQVMESLPHVGDDAIVGYGRNPTGRLTASQNGHVFLTDPMVREMAFQTAGLWGMKKNELSYLPYKVGRARQYGTARPGEGINVRCLRRDDASEHAIAFDVEVRAQDGRLLQVMEKVEMIGHRRLEESENFGDFPTRRMTVRRLSYPEAELMLNDAGLEPDDVLVDEEREAFERLISDRRRSEWLAARVAAKDLVACHLRNFYGYRPALADVVVLKDDNGAPYIELRGEAATALPDAELPPTTITHSHGVAIAGIAAPGEPSTVGIDLEVIEPRNDSFAKNYFTENERQLEVPSDLLGSDDDPRSTLLTLLWSIKESVSKALGLGLNLKLGEVLVTGLRKDGEDVRATVQLRERAEQAYAELGGRSLEVCSKLDGTFALSLAWLELAEAIDQSQPVDIRNDERAERTPKASTPDNWAEHAAVAALLKHKGLLKQSKLGDAKVKGEDISPWKA
jgi:NAD(P)-dependent dehydrogenase (short-subunit alcohol dehydrogenase family)/phosphopantetheinyl transferase